MADAAAQFREYIRLDRLQRTDGLSPRDLERWMLLKRKLSQRVSPGLSDARADERTSIRVPIRMRASFADAEQMRGRVMTNMSRGGIFVASDHRIEIGTRLQLRIEIETTGEMLEVPVEVASHNVGPNFEADPPGMGLRFLDMDDETRGHLERLYDDALRSRMEKRR